MGVSDVFSGFSLLASVVVEILLTVRGRLRELLGGSCCGIDLLNRSLLEGGSSVLGEEEEPNMDSVSDGAAVLLLPKRFMVAVSVAVWLCAAIDVDARVGK